MQVMFPIGLRLTAGKAWLTGQSSDPQQAISGAFSVQPRLTGYWQATGTFLVTNEATAQALTAFVFGMEGMLGTTLFPIFQRDPAKDSDGQRAPWRGLGQLGDGDPWEGRGSQTFEAFGFANAPVVTAVLAEAAGLRATRIKVAYVNSTGLRPGHKFSIGDRLYAVQLAWEEAGIQVLQITPPLRAAAPEGAVLVLDAPVCLMRFANADQGQFTTDLTRFVSVELQMIEAI